MKLELSFFCAVVSLILFSAEAGEFFTSAKGFKYYVEQVKMHDWYDAIHLCDSRNMTLITPDTQEKNSEISKIIEKFRIDQSLWTSGLEFENLNFVWTTNGNMLNYTDWYRGEPARNGNKTQRIAISPLYDRKWRSYTSERLLTVLCEESSYVREKNSEIEYLNVLRKFLELERNQMLEEKTREINDCPMKTNQLSFNKNLEEVIKKTHERDFELLFKEITAMKNSIEILHNRTSTMNNNNFLFSIGGNRT